MQHLTEMRFEHWVAAPVERIFRFFAAPANLPQLTPMSLHLRIDAMELVPPLDGPQESGFAGAGSKILVSFRPPFSPVRLKHLATITSYQWCSHFQDENTTWYQTWKHRHEFEAAMKDGLEGTLVRDIVQVHMFCHGLTCPLIIRPMLRQMFRARQLVLERMVESKEI